MKTFQLKKEIWIWLIVVLPFIVFLMVQDRLPAKIPSHYNLKGEVDAYQAPLSFFLLTGGINLFLYFLLLVLPRIDPKKANYPLFAKTYFIIRLFVHLVLTAIFCLSIMTALGVPLNINKIILLLVMLLFILLGNYLGNVRPNWFVGIRTPWTLSNETVWRKTHQLGGRLMFFSGLAGFIAALFIHAAYMYLIIAGVVIVGALVPAVYSYLIFHKYEDDSAAHS